MPNLRQRRHVDTRIDLVAAAFGLFAERGYGEISMDDIAKAAGVSRSTAYRRFPSKEDVVLEVAKRWLDAFDTAADDLSSDTPLTEAIAQATRAVATHIDDNMEIARASYAILEQAPTLKVSGIATTEWASRMVALIERHGDVDRETAAVIAGAYLGALDAMMVHWASTGDRESVVAATRRVIDLLRPVLR